MVSKWHHDNLAEFSPTSKPNVTSQYPIPATSIQNTAQQSADFFKKGMLTGWTRNRKENYIELFFISLSKLKWERQKRLNIFGFKMERK
jgi:hypothetical protein